jgi:hypothetical protein
VRPLLYQLSEGTTKHPSRIEISKGAHPNRVRPPSQFLSTLKIGGFSEREMRFETQYLLIIYQLFPFFHRHFI